ncbi:MAG: polyphosphate polymerase domain-containing protein [Clostridia bacterium]|nr:polyphosphate polymerase domain-containing protein [Clostridia bacterium]
MASQSTLPLRHELKFLISPEQEYVLSRALDRVLKRDPNGDEHNEYAIRSLYFDTVYNDALFDKIDGVQNRDKYRVRIYNYSDRVIKLECKTKIGSLISKRSISIPRELCEQLMAGDPTGLEQTRSGLLCDMYREMTIHLLRPVVLVDYVREAYLHDAEEVRITLDKHLRSGMRSIDLFDPHVPVIPPLEHDETILEVKYNRALPTYIRSLLNTYAYNAVHTAVSKYTWCRAYEGLEA